MVSPLVNENRLRRAINLIVNTKFRRFVLLKAQYNYKSKFYMKKKISSWDHFVSIICFSVYIHLSFKYFMEPVITQSF